MIVPDASSEQLHSGGDVVLATLGVALAGDNQVPPAVRSRLNGSEGVWTPQPFTASAEIEAVVRTRREEARERELALAEAATGQ